jgi:hypothetical protein
VIDIRCTRVEEVDSVLTVTLAEGPGEQGFLLRVMRALPGDDEVFDAELETYELANATHDVVEGGVDEWAIDAEVLSVALSAQAASSLQVPRQLVLKIHGNAVQPVGEALLKALAPIGAV